MHSDNVVVLKGPNKESWHGLLPVYDMCGLLRGWLTGLFSMPKNYNFMIESERSGHKLSLNGQEVAMFPTREAAEAEANKIADRAIPGAKLRFELDFKLTLTDLEIRGATLEFGNRPGGQGLANQDSLCGS